MMVCCSRFCRPRSCTNIEKCCPYRSPDLAVVRGGDDVLRLDLLETLNGPDPPTTNHCLCLLMPAFAYWGISCYFLSLRPCQVMPSSPWVFKAQAVRFRRICYQPLICHVFHSCNADSSGVSELPTPSAANRSTLKFRRGRK